MIALCISLTWEKPAYVFISPSTNIPYVNVTEQFSSRAVMFVLINLSIYVYLYNYRYIYSFESFVSCKLGRCITFIVNLTYCISPNELTFKIKYPNYMVSIHGILN
jgi:hypothetical protein